MATNFEDTVVRVERVIAYWPSEALALKEGLIKFQSYIEGERIDAITDHSVIHNCQGLNDIDAQSKDISRI